MLKTEAKLVGRLENLQNPRDLWTVYFVRRPENLQKPMEYSIVD